MALELFTTKALAKLAPGGTVSPWSMMLESKQRSREVVQQQTREIINKLAAGELGWPLSLLGDTGWGKTCAAMAMTDYYGGWYADLPGLHSLMIGAMQGKIYWNGRTGKNTGPQATDRSLWNHWKKQPLCVLDELGTRTPTDAMFETCKKAIDFREGKPLVVVSNLTLNALAKVYDDRIARRLDCGTVHTCKGRFCSDG